MDLAERVRRGRQAIVLAEVRGLETAEWRHYLQELLDTAGLKPGAAEGFEPWALWEWRRVSIPEWRGILATSVEQCDRKREDYARWMLSEVVLDKSKKHYFGSCTHVGNIELPVAPFNLIWLVRGTCAFRDSAGNRTPKRLLVSAALDPAGADSWVAASAVGVSLRHVLVYRVLDEGGYLVDWGEDCPGGRVWRHPCVNLFRAKAHIAHCGRF